MCFFFGSLSVCVYSRYGILAYVQHCFSNTQLVLLVLLFDFIHFSFHYIFGSSMLKLFTDSDNTQQMLSFNVFPSLSLSGCSLTLLWHFAVRFCHCIVSTAQCTVCSLVFLLNILLQFLSPLHFFIWLQRTIQWTELNNNVVDSPNGYYMKLLMILSMLMSSHFQPRSFVYRNTNRIHLRSTLVGTMFQWTHKHTQQQQLMFGSIRCCELILCVRAPAKNLFSIAILMCLVKGLRINWTRVKIDSMVLLLN